MSENEKRRAARKRLQAQYRALYDEVVDILFEIDPIGVHVHHNVEKFVPEATRILARLRDARFAEDVENIVPVGAATLVWPAPTRPPDPQRLAHATIGICSAWNRFLDESAGL
jgi:hypothetical protein